MLVVFLKNWCIMPQHLEIIMKWIRMLVSQQYRPKMNIIGKQWLIKFKCISKSWILELRLILKRIKLHISIHLLNWKIKILFSLRIKKIKLLLKLRNIYWFVLEDVQPFWRIYQILQNFALLLMICLNYKNHQVKHW